jgi:DNA-binding CsgD family transcriptional regulator
VSVQTFRSIHGLTPAESHLVGELANGLTLDQIARRFQVTKNTVRDQLKSVFAKTGIRRQAELIRLIRATPTTFVNETILFGTTKPNPMEQRQDVDRRLSGRVTVQADS